MTGLHIILDISQVPCNVLKDISRSSIEEYLASLISRAGFEILGGYYHCFWKENEVTGVIALAESHVSFHVWPEDAYVSFDIFVCNFSRDNTYATKKLTQEIENMFPGSVIERQEIVRKSSD